MVDIFRGQLPHMFKYVRDTRKMNPLKLTVIDKSKLVNHRKHSIIQQQTKLKL